MGTRGGKQHSHFWRTGVLILTLFGAALSAAASTFTVKATEVTDPCGERLVLRGVNAGIAFPADTTASKIGEVAKTGANTVRLTFRWLINNSTPKQVETALAATAAAGMVAMPALWDATGIWSQLPFAADYWAQPEMVAVLREYEDTVLLNIANEAGAYPVSDQEYRAGYGGAIKQLRAAGLHMPLVIDAANWGRREADILNNAQYLLAEDPDHNLLFSWHPWDTNQPLERYRQAMDRAKALGITLIIGEFSSSGADNAGPVDYRGLMELAAEYDVGWLWWWWWSGSSVDRHSLTTNGLYGNWANVGEEVAISGAHGLAATSKRTHYLRHGQCETFQPPLEAPAAPTNLHAVATEGSEILLSWDDNSDNEKNFDIEVWNESLDAWRLIKVVGPDTTSAGVGGDLAFVYNLGQSSDASLRHGMSYQFRVGAYRSKGAVSHSAPITVSTAPDARVCAGGYGLKGEYYSADHLSQDFDDYTGPNMVRTDPRILFNWGTASPHPSRVAVDHFQVRWTGYLQPQFSGTYSIYTNSDDFARVWIDDKLIIDNWRANAIGWALGRIELEAGSKYPIRVEYRDWTDKAKMELHWAHSRLSREVIPRCRLFPR